MSPRSKSDWIRSLADERAVDEGCYFSLPAADRVRQFFAKYLRHSKGQWAGKPFELLDWQWQDVIAPLFGWKKRNGTRRFRRAYVELPKKNGKSTLASAIGLYLLAGDGEAGAEVYSCATNRDQASIVHGEAIRMVEASEPLTARLAVNRSTKTISFQRTQSWYKALTGESDSQEGLNAHGLIIDELHAWKGRALWDALRYAGRSRRQPLLFVITTAGDDVLSVCYEQHQYALDNARTGDDTRHFGYIRAAAAEDDWKDPGVWSKANPSLGQTIDAEAFAADAAEAARTPTSAASFKRYGLNIWQTSSSPWLRVEDWLKCASTTPDLRGLTCYGGLDLAKTRDLTAFVLCFKDGDAYRLLPYFWLPEDTINDPDSPEQYRVWAAKGLIEVTPGNVCDYRFIRHRVADLAKDYRLQSFAYDPYNAEQITQEIADEIGVKRYEFRQTINIFAEPTKEFERLVIAGQMRHPAHPVLDWHIGNTSVKTDVNNNKRPVKPPDGDKRKIDGAVAAIMALGLAMREAGGSVYDSREMLIL